MRKDSILMVLLALLLLTGCVSKIDLGPGYDNLSQNFLQAMRWKDFQGAALYLKDEDRQQLLESFDKSEDLHIVEAEYGYSRLDKKAGTAESELILKYYLLPSPRIKNWEWKIDWALIPVDTKQRGTWQVQNASPPFP